MCFRSAMTQPLLLFIAYHFPPNGAIGGARPYRFYKYLKRHGYDCHVLTAAKQPERDEAPDVQYVPDPLVVNPRSGIAWQAERIGWKFFLRAELVLGWSAAAYRAGAPVLASHAARPAAVLSSGPPVGTHVAAWRLAQRFGVPWIADFRDPIDNSAGDHAPLQNLLAPRLEYKVLKNSRLALANTDAMRDRWIARYPDLQNKIHVLWNGFDPEDRIEQRPAPSRDRKILSHVGELYGGRDMRPIVEAFDRMIRKNELPASRFCIRQIGPVEPGELPPREFLDAAQAEGWLELKEPVAPPEARTLALESDGLLLIQPHTAVQVPGKLFEYLRIGRPILAFVVRGSPVERILERAGVPYTCLYPEESPFEKENKLREYFAKLHPEPSGPSEWFQHTFDGARQAGTLDRLIRQVLPSD